jgi:hypothetical protein
MDEYNVGREKFHQPNPYSHEISRDVNNQIDLIDLIDLIAFLKSIPNQTKGIHLPSQIKSPPTTPLG